MTFWEASTWSGETRASFVVAENNIVELGLAQNVYTMLTRGIMSHHATSL
jgi:hypothetical protein